MSAFGQEMHGGKGGTYIAEADILNESRVQVAALANLLQKSVHHVLEAGVLETALAGLGERRSNGQGDDDVVGILGLTAKTKLARVAGTLSRNHTYIWLMADPGARCLMMEPMRSTAIVSDVVESSFLGWVYSQWKSQTVSRLDEGA
jgi:hypothetical protein